MMKCCFNKKVLIGAGVITLALLVISPTTALAALPVLIVAVCPLSMLLMMRTMRNGTQCDTTDSQQDAERAAEIASLHEEINLLKARQRALNDDATRAQDAGPGPPTAPANTSRLWSRAETQKR